VPKSNVTDPYSGAGVLVADIRQRFSGTSVKAVIRPRSDLRRAGGLKFSIALQRSSRLLTLCVTEDAAIGDLFLRLSD
jgi:hypothetical protein